MEVGMRSLVVREGVPLPRRTAKNDRALDSTAVQGYVR